MDGKPQYSNLIVDRLHTAPTVQTKAYGDRYGTTAGTATQSKNWPQLRQQALLSSEDEAAMINLLTSLIGLNCMSLNLKMNECYLIPVVIYTSLNIGRPKTKLWVKEQTCYVSIKARH